MTDLALWIAAWAHLAAEGPLADPSLPRQDSGMNVPENDHATTEADVSLVVDRRGPLAPVPGLHRLANYDRLGVRDHRRLFRVTA